MSGIPITKEIFNRLVNTGGVKKTLKCRKCKDFKSHISVSNAEVYGDHDLLKLLGRLNDVNPLSNVGLGTPYVCMSCRNMILDEGIASDFVNKIRQNYREVFVHNKTYLEVRVIARYLDEDDEWETISFSFSPQEKAKILGGSNRKTSNRYVYLYAKTMDGEYVWEGNDSYQTVDSEERGFMMKDIGEKSSFTWSIAID